MPACKYAEEEFSIGNIDVSGLESESAVDEAVLKEILKRANLSRQQACEGDCDNEGEFCRLVLIRLKALMTLHKHGKPGEWIEVTAADLTQHYSYLSPDGKLLHGGYVKKSGKEDSGRPSTHLDAKGVSSCMCVKIPK